MKRILCFLAPGVVAISLLAADAPVKNSVEGDWVPVKAELGGQAMDEALLKTISMSLEKGKYHVSVAGNPDDGTYELQPATNPKTMVVHGTEGPNKGRAIPAIYDLTGDTLSICFDLSRTNAHTPKEFKSTAGTRLYLVTYQRKK